VFAEYVLILFHFGKWNEGFDRKYYLPAGIGMIVWIADNLVVHQINQDNSLFRIFYSFIIVLFSIQQINKLVLAERKDIVKSAVFLICIVFTVYYTCKAFVEVFNAFDLGFSSQFNRHVFTVLYFANLLSNIVYFIAILCIPAKQEFTMPY